MKRYFLIFSRLKVRSSGSILVLGAVIACLVLSCTTRSMRRTRMFEGVLEKERYLDAIQTIRKNPKAYGNINRFLYWFDQGVLFHYAGEFDSSLVHLEKAETVLDELYTRSITNEAASLLTNDNLRPYRSRPYEEVLLHQFISFDYMAKDELDESLVETRKVQLVFDRLEKAHRASSKYTSDGMSHFISALLYEAQGETDNSVISLFKSVSAYNNGPVPLPQKVGEYAARRLVAAGRPDDIASLGLKPDSSIEQAGGLSSGQTEIIIVAYGGLGPILEETVFWGEYIVGGMLIGYYRNPYGDTIALSLPAPPLPESELKKIEKGKKTKAGSTFSIKFSIPSPVRRPSRVDRFSASVTGAEGKTEESLSLTDTDLLLEKNIEDQQMATLLRTAVRVVLRTIAAQRAKAEMATKDPFVNAFLNMGTDLLAGQLEKADTRLCFFLPRTIQVMRIPVTAGAHRVEAVALDKGNNVVSTHTWVDVAVKANEKRFLFFPALL